MKLAKLWLLLFSVDFYGILLTVYGYSELCHRHHLIDIRVIVDMKIFITSHECLILNDFEVKYRQVTDVMSFGVTIYRHYREYYIVNLNYIYLSTSLRTKFFMWLF